MRYILLALLIFTTPAFGVTPEDVELYGPVDMAKVLQRALDKLSPAPEIAPDEDNDSSNKKAVSEIPEANDFIAKAFTNERWILTRTVFWGADNIDGAVAILKDPKTIAALTKNNERVTKEAIELLRMTEKSDDEDEAKEYEYEAPEITEYYYSEATKVRDFIGDLVGSFESIEKLPGLKGDLTMYKMTSTLGFVLLVLFFAIRLTWDVMTIVLGMDGEKNIIDCMYMSAKFMFLYLAISYLSSVVFYGLSLSDKIVESVLGSIPGDVSQIVSDLMRVKMILADLKAGSFWDIFTSGAGDFLAGFFGWAAYYLATFTIFILILMADILLSLSVLLAPICFSISLIPTMENFLSGWVKGYLTSLMWVPLSAIYAVMLLAIMAIGIDTSIGTFIIISIAYIQGAMRLPQMAESMSGMVLAAVATTLTAYPIIGAKMGVNIGKNATVGTYRIAKSKLSKG